MQARTLLALLVEMNLARKLGLVDKLFPCPVFSGTGSQKPFLGNSGNFGRVAYSHLRNELCTPVVPCQPIFSKQSPTAKNEFGRQLLGTNSTRSLWPLTRQDVKITKHSQFASHNVRISENRSTELCWIETADANTVATHRNDNATGNVRPMNVTY